MSLAQFTIVKTVAKHRPPKLSDGDGSDLLVQSGGRMPGWFLYRFAGRENMLAFGAFPEVSLAAARSKRDEARKLIALSTYPSVKRKLAKIAAATAAQNSFGAVAAENLASKPTAAPRASSVRTAGYLRIWPRLWQDGP
jgi:hypothetical protein